MSQSPWHSEVLTSEQIQEIAASIARHAEAGREEAAWTEARTLLHAQRHQREAAGQLLTVVAQGHFPPKRVVAVLEAVYRSHSQDEDLLRLIGLALERARGDAPLNAAPPDLPLFLSVVDVLSNRVTASPQLLVALASAASVMARQHDEVAESAHRQLIALKPDSGAHHYDLGLFLKNRGRFREGMEANQAAARLFAAPDEATQWNLGICATGAGEGAVALAVWRAMGVTAELGRFGLPDGSFPPCKVRLAQRPLAQRTAATDDPGLEETIWVEPLSPCHGIVRSVLLQELGVDYGDVVLWDGAPIARHSHEGRQVPVFPHLVTLARRRYQMFDFLGTQQEPGQLADASDDLEPDAVIYSHSESVEMVCARCMEDPGREHQHESPVESGVVAGKIAAPPYMSARKLLQQIDAAVARRPGCRVFVPGLCEAAGLHDRAQVELRRLRMITRSS
jgi:hypothetical protein